MNFQEVCIVFKCYISSIKYNTDIIWNELFQTDLSDTYDIDRQSVFDKMVTEISLGVREFFYQIFGGNPAVTQGCED